MSDQQIYNFFKYTTEPPKMLGQLHITALLITSLLVVFFCIRFSKSSEAVVRSFIFICWLILLIFETYRQISYSIRMGDEGIYWDYDWGQLPLQVCSVQLYALPFIVFLKDGRLRNSFICIMMTWSLIGGLGVTIYPGNTFIDLFGITIQSIVHHAIQVILGIFLAVRYGPRLGYRDFFGGFLVFTIYFFIAMWANVMGPELLSDKHVDDAINMFFLSPYHQPLIEVLNRIRNATSHSVMVIIYMGLFHIGAAIVFQIELILTSGRKRITKREIAA